MNLWLPQNLTVAIVLHNEARRLGILLKTLESVEGMAQVASIMFVDNASTDETPQILRDYQQKSSWNTVVHVRDRNHLGEARNDVLTKSSTRWVLFCDADCLPPSDWLMNYQSAVMELNEKSGAVYAGVGGPARPLRPGTSKGMAELLSYAPWTHLQSAQGALRAEAWDADHLPCSNVLLDRDLVLRSGGFSSALGSVGEDLELGLRLRDQGLLWRVVPQLELDHQRDFNLPCWAIKMLSYGRAQVRVGRLRKKYHFRALAALFAASMGLLWILLVFLWPGAGWLMLSLYGAGVALQSLLCPGLHLGHRFYGMLLIAATHIFYASGALIEFVAPQKSLG
jgi:glycosyltransferase involved in cell wall biosynthesis